MEKFMAPIIFITFYVLTLSTTSVSSVPNADDQKIELIDIKDINTTKYSIILSENDQNAVKIVPKTGKLIDMVLISSDVLWLKKGGDKCSEILLIKISEDHVLISLKLIKKKESSVISFVKHHDTIIDTGNLSSFLLLNDLSGTIMPIVEHETSEDKSFKHHNYETEIDETFNISWEFDKLYYLSTKEPGSKHSKVYEPCGSGKIKQIYDFGKLICKASEEEKSFTRIEVHSSDKIKTKFLLATTENNTTKYFRLNADWNKVEKDFYDKFLGEFIEKLGKEGSSGSKNRPGHKIVSNSKPDPNSGSDNDNDLLYPSGYGKFSTNLSNIKITRLAPSNIYTVDTTNKFKILGTEITLRNESQVTELFIIKLSNKLVLVEICLRHEGVRYKNAYYKRTLNEGRFTGTNKSELFDALFNDFSKNENKVTLKYTSVFPIIQGKETGKMPDGILDIILPDHPSVADAATQTEEVYTPTYEMKPQEEPVDESNEKEPMTKVELSHENDTKKQPTHENTKHKRSVSKENKHHPESHSDVKKKLRQAEKSSISSFLPNKIEIILVALLLIC
ncbi:hypothetical protein TpMuguga_04g00028 [Theileria parva strain Muguga]|uniref:Uncharacterized protein n=1 Tax=Theileria parva TaxID=5875 RepID=Q4N3F9_THEPA|nr:uncharacterized protein TpMuguga_04g00028 [Theileria parva strain Muguga]EAN31380.1 hypothetical protein TpMuguga_04g00028 [Theileria parva strain Muguga]|eukprot:XP_763663.1 hypothetical protein [Theileria parva strain Muguga]